MHHFYNLFCSTLPYRCGPITLCCLYSNSCSRQDCWFCNVVWYTFWKCQTWVYCFIIHKTITFAMLPLSKSNPKMFHVISSCMMYELSIIHLTIMHKCAYSHKKYRRCKIRYPVSLSYWKYAHHSSGKCKCILWL